jgi:sporulation related protein
MACGAVARTSLTLGTRRPGTCRSRGDHSGHLAPCVATGALQVEANAAKPKRSAPTVTKDHVWVRGAAFSDRDSAERFAARIEHQGYAAKVRREKTPTTPWVVWIDHHPRGMTPAERHK